VRHEFDVDWYLRSYGKQISCGPNEDDVFSFYIAEGARLGHDPNRDFSEVLYRTANRDVYENILAEKDQFGFSHFVAFGRSEMQRPQQTERERAIYRAIVAHLDFDHLRQDFGAEVEGHLTPIDFYFQNVRLLAISPNRDFSEAGYRKLNPDVGDAVERGRVLSGFAHYLTTSHDEFRPTLTCAEADKLNDTRSHNAAALERNLPGVTRPAALELIDQLEFLTSGGYVSVQPSTQRSIVLVVPNFFPEIFFGGYTSFIDYLRQVRLRYDAKLIAIVHSNLDKNVHRSNMIRMRGAEQERYRLFDSVQLVGSGDVAVVPAGSAVLSYSAETHRFAARVADKLKTVPIFFIQEYEPDFHPAGDMRTFAETAFQLPHRSIYNSCKLMEHCESRFGPTAPADAAEWSCCFEPTIEPIGLGLEEFLGSHAGEVRTLIFYGRPEAHASRNHFATFVRGLREAVEAGHFDGPEVWSFISVGSLDYEGSIDLGRGHFLDVRSKMPYQAYMRLLREGDIGASFISTPHPGIVHFRWRATAWSR
jgi:hypothetical protein